MDLLYLAYYLSLFAGPVIIYVVFVKKTKTGPYSRPVWYYAFKKLFARTEVSRLQDYARHTLKNVPALQQELPRQIANEYESESVVYYAADVEGNHFILKMWLKSTMHMDVSVTYRTKEGQIYKLSGEPTVKTFSVSARQWKAGGLSIEILDPLKNLRITYRGHMTTTDGQKEYINYNFFWTAGTIPIHHPQDVNIELLTDGVAREPWRDGEWINMLGEDRGFEQYGVLHGFFNTSSEEIKVYMPSWRRRRWGPIDSLAIKRDFCIFGVQKDGTIFCVGARSMRVGSTQLRYGSILLNNGELKSISGSDISLEDLGDNMNVPSVFTFHFEAASKTIKCVAHVNTKRTLITTCEDQRGWIEKTTNAECDLNSEQAVAIVNFWYKRPGPGVKLPPPLLSPSSIENPEEVFIASLTSPQALDLSITGGKGNSLALLSSMQSNDFIVPPGFVVTVTSFKKHLEENPSLIDGLEYLQNVCCGVVRGNPEETCKKITEVFTNTPISEEISDLIKEEIRALKKECDDTDWTWAVRSSGVGEDSEELSAAGQNSTFLGCKSDDDVIKGVQACWGSLFAFQSVEYRRQHGLPIRCDMGVVVQKMVPADTAGVLFTCHPATGNPSQMVITSNYGLGESVVSASADPDTITLSRSFDDVLKIHTTVIGAKKTQITLGASNGIENTEEKEIEEALAGRLSISEQEAMLLGRVGVRLEEAFGNPRDIEWAFCDGRLYLLQSRPITTLATWTDWELTHEFDTPVFSNENIYTRANVGEVVKGAVTPLTQSFTMNFLDQVMQEEAYQVSKDIRKTLVCNSHFVFLDVLNFLYSKVSPTISLEHVVTDLAIFGHQVLNEDLLRTALHKHGPFEGYEKLKYNLGQFDRVRTNLSVRDRAVKLRDSWAIYVKDSDTPSDIFEKIEINAPNLASSLKCHTSTTTSSIIYQMITMIVLAEKHKERIQKYTQGNTSFFDNIGRIAAFMDAQDVLLESVKIKALLESDSKFDLMIQFSVFNAFIGLANHFDVPVIVFLPVGGFLLVDDKFGNPYPASYVPNRYVPFSDGMNFWQRLVNTLTNLLLSALSPLFAYYTNLAVEKHFPAGPSYHEMQKRIQMAFINTHVSIETPRPYVPAMVQIGGFHLQEPEPLPADLKTILDGSTNGVIYFSFGTNVKISDLPQDKLDILMKSLRELPLKVLMKSETATLDHKPDNIEIRSWFPQRGILSHPNVKLFISHGGYGGCTESLYYGVPMICIPFVTDQPKNCADVDHNGYGIHLPLNKLSTDTLNEALEKVLYDQKFITKAKLKSELYRDQEMNPMDRAAYWVNHVIKHKGAKHLRVKALDLAWYQYYLLDVIAFMLFVIIVVSIICIYILKYCLNRIFRRYKKIKTN